MMSEMCIQVITFFWESEITDKFNKICPVSLPKWLTFWFHTVNVFTIHDRAATLSIFCLF